MNENVLRHFVLYAKGHYYTGDIASDLIALGQAVNEKVSTPEHVIQLISDLVYSIIQTHYQECVIPGRPPMDAAWLFKELWVALVIRRHKFKPAWDKYQTFHRLTDSERAELERMFTEEFVNQVLNAFLIPLLWWIPTVDLGEPDCKKLTRVHHTKKSEKEGG